MPPSHNPLLPIPRISQVALMPLIAWRRRPESRDFVARSASAVAAAVAEVVGEGEHGCSASTRDSSLQQATTDCHSSMVAGLFDPRVAAWMLDTGRAGKALEFEALCVSWLEDEEENAAGEGGRMQRRLRRCISCTAWTDLAQESTSKDCTHQSPPPP